jgi:Peroxidase
LFDSRIKLIIQSVGNCGEARIPFRAGRIDATGGGAFGVPAPETDLPTTLGFFGGAGFNQVDSIGLTACGHTLGSVHHVILHLLDVITHLLILSREVSQQ